MKIVVILLTFCILSEVRISEAACDLPDGCFPSGTNGVQCSGISKFPDCMPEGATKLTIKNSPNLTSIESIPKGVEELYLSDTNLSEIDDDAFSDVKLKTLNIIRDQRLNSIDLGKPSTDDPLLTTLYLANCTNLGIVSNVNEYTNLRSVTISFCNLKSIGEDQFKNLRYLTNLDISHNHQLSYIHEEAFEDLVSMQYLDMSHCKLYKLYGDYFDNAYHHNLKLVSTLRNPLQCFQMCDFMKWYWGHRGFYSIAAIGTCTYDAGDTIYIDQVYDLGRYSAGCPPLVGIIIGATLGAFFFICIVSCIIVVACGIDYRKYCCFCFESQRNRRQEEVESSANDRQDGDNTFTHVYNVSNEKTVMYSEAPPSYNDLNQDIQVSSNVQSQ